MNTHEYCGNMQILDIAHWHLAFTRFCDIISCAEKKQMRIIHATNTAYRHLFISRFNKNPCWKIFACALLFFFVDIRFIYIKMSFNAKIHFIPYVTLAYIIYPVLSCRSPTCHYWDSRENIRKWITRCVLWTFSY